MRVKICGITQPEQGRAIANLGATALGFICVRQSPRHVAPAQIRAIVAQLPSRVDRIGVFVNASGEKIGQIVASTGLTGVQLHGDESPEFCRQLRQSLPGIEVIKAFRIRTSQSLSEIDAYCDRVDTLLLDAYHPQLLGGTGETLDWETLAQFRPPRPWLLAGGLNPDNVLDALKLLNPSGIDLSSGVERSAGDKDLARVERLFQKLKVFPC
ncbi:MAG: phosphoribosylanthranilate isomerase [Hydrococcus sp. C42_A2020_068]|uniref:phosphoribosylanthranilate isomerase n=1 Tax=Pleurocapsa sp. PCC 7327 TaxID=118163 RepID=UPI00029F8BA2|nr:phosphoribosylanthranilate isomerase [Pleurocapsa sp. PCC 7327]AFY76992.1 phosphoribosylanthranilate isomerase [Pleurocapsa sp. PCC 7327]MBF2022459.1 phosphoribosylanthranilate isomerase [Hydrococcus sp. C42_A2020_068]